MAIGEREARWVKAHSKAIVDLPDDVFAELLKKLPDLMSVSSRAMADDYVVSIARDRSIDENVVRAGTAWLTLSANIALTESADEVRRQVIPLFDAQSGLEIYKHRLERLIEAASENSSGIQMALQRRASVRGLLPYYEEVNATVELRAILDDTSGVLGHLGRGEAKIIAVEPVATVRIIFDSGFPGEAIFQAGRDDIVHVVSSLNDLLRRMDEIGAFVGRAK